MAERGVAAEDWERQRTGLECFCELLAEVSPGARVVRHAAVTAAITPAAAGRSLCNCVTYRDAEALAVALPRLAVAYADAGVWAWTVWMPGGDAYARRILEGAGHRLDASPRAMIAGLPLAGPGPAEPDDWTADGDLRDVGAINDGAYGLPGDFSRAMAGGGGGTAHVHVARERGIPVACVVTRDRDGDCGVYMVATLPEARGRGLAGGLMARALADGAARGCTTTTLQATAAGAPLYARLGYRDLGPLEMWERREGAPPS